MTMSVFNSLHYPYSSNPYTIIHPYEIYEAKREEANAEMKITKTGMAKLLSEFSANTNMARVSTINITGKP